MAGDGNTGGATDNHKNSNAVVRSKLFKRHKAGRQQSMSRERQERQKRRTCALPSPDSSPATSPPGPSALASPVLLAGSRSPKHTQQRWAPSPVVANHAVSLYRFTTVPPTPSELIAVIPVRSRKSQSYEPLLLENEREAVADLLQYLESESLAASRFTSPLLN